MDLRALGYFVSIYETGSLSAASKASFVAQPSISASLKQLEQDLSSPLFIRHARGVKATAAGEQLYPLAKQLIGQADAIRLLFDHSKFKIPFRLGLTKGLGVERISAVLRNFTASTESLELTLVSPDEPNDARIISRDMLQNGEKFVFIWQEQFQLAMPHVHPLALKKEIAISDLQGLAFILRSPCEGWNQLRKQLQTADIKLDVRARIQTIEYALGLIKAGLGCAFIPVSDEVAMDTEINFRPLKDIPLSREIGLGYRQESAIIESLKHILAN